MGACDSINCPLNSSVEAYYTFCDLHGNRISISDTLTVSAVGTDQVLVNKLSGKSEMTVPVSYYAETDTLVLHLCDDDDMEATDTIWMDKVSTPHSDDPGCPYHVWHKVTAVRHTHYLIDTIIIVHPDINYDGLENLQIHFITE